MPLPTEVELRVHDSPLPTQIVSWFVGSIVTAPIDCTSCLSNTGLNVVPESVDFQTPPDAAPTISVVLPSLPGTAAIAAMRPLIWAEPMLRAPRPEITPASKRGAAALSDGLSAALTASEAPSAAAISVVSETVRRWLFFEFMVVISGSVGLAGRECEHAVFDRRVRFGVVDRRLRAVAVGLALARHREREEDAVDLLVVAVVGRALVQRAAHVALRDHADLEEVIGIEIDVVDVAVLQRDLELVRVGAVDVLGAKVLDLVAALLRADQRAGDRRIVGERFRVVGRHLLGILAALERRDLPGLLAVPRLHGGEALDARL